MWCDTSKYSREPFKFIGITLPDIAGLDLECDLILLLSPDTDGNTIPVVVGTSERLQKRPEHEHDCTMEFDWRPSNLANQVKAVERLCSGAFTRWHPILLNQEYTALPKIDLFDGLPEAEIQTAYTRIFELQNWNERQLDVFKLLRHVPGKGFAFIEGIFGCGKTHVQVTLAKLLVDLGLHVLIVAPTNAAIQALSRTLVKNIPSLDAVRVVCDDATEMERFKDQADNSEAHDDSGHANDDDCLREETQSHAKFRLLGSRVSFRAFRYNVVPEHDLQTHVDDLVQEMMECNETLDLKYHKQEDAGDLEDDLFKKEKQTESHDAIKIYSEHKNTDFHSLLKSCTSTAEEVEVRQTLQLFQAALEVIQAEVIRRTKVVFCTHQLAASSLIKDNFACRDTNGVVIIADEDGQALEPVGWIPVIIPRCAPDVKAVLRFGDRFQLHPLALSATTPWNEFGAQINRSLLDRHLQTHPPAVSLNTQYRMHPDLASFPNDFTCRGKLENGELCSSIQVEPLLDQRLKQWGKQHVAHNYAIENDEKFTRLLGLNVVDSKTEINKSTFSKYNRDHIRAVRDMLSTLFEKQPYPDSEITIITPYSAQLGLYYEMLREMHLTMKVPLEKLPRVATIDSMQGHESDVIILDWVIGYYDHPGFLMDDRRVNVALTRCRSSLIVVSHQPPNVIDVEPGRLKYQRRDGRMPELLEHWNDLMRSGLVIDV